MAFYTVCTKNDCLRHLFIDIVVINQMVRKDNVVIDWEY